VPVQALTSGYRWLKWVPNGMIKSAFAAEWKLQSYRLGKPPSLVHRPVANDSQVESTPKHAVISGTPSQNGSRVSLTPHASPSPGYAKGGLARRASQMSNDRDDVITSAGLLLSPSSPTSQPAKYASRVEAPLRLHSADLESANFSFGGGSVQTPSSSKWSAASSLISPAKDSRLSIGSEAGSLLGSMRRDTSPPKKPSDLSLDADKPPTDAALLHALDQASHAECEPGTTDDLLTIILNRPARPWGFSYADLTHPATIWWGSEDERISERSVRWMERVMCGETELRVVQGGDHNLMRNVPIMCEIFQNIADETRLEGLPRDDIGKRAAK
jgi:pimeloyl-ACP methyl ester carboxylesterase